MVYNTIFMSVIEIKKATATTPIDQGTLFHLPGAEVMAYFDEQIGWGGRGILVAGKYSRLATNGTPAQHDLAAIKIAALDTYDSIGEAIINVANEFKYLYLLSMLDPDLFPHAYCFFAEVEKDQIAQLYLVMKLLSKNWENAHVFNWSSTDIEDIFFFAYQMTQILDLMARNKIIHRDIKPKNVMINSQTLQTNAIDFGFAINQKIANGRRHHIAGTTMYMPPEAWEPNNDRLGPVSPLSDLYSFTLCLYYLFTGKHLFNGHDHNEVIEKIRKRPNQVGLPALERGILEAALVTRLGNTNQVKKIADTIDKGVKKHPSDRFQRPKDLLVSMADADTAERQANRWKNEIKAPYQIPG